MAHWKHLLDELRKEITLREDELQLLHSIDTQLLESERPLNTTFDFIVQQTRVLLEADHVGILLRRGRFVEPAYTTNNAELGQRISIDSCLAGECIMTNSPVSVPDVNSAPPGRSYIPIKGYAGAPMLSLLAAPINCPRDHGRGAVRGEHPGARLHDAARDGHRGNSRTGRDRAAAFSTVRPERPVCRRRQTDTRAGRLTASHPVGTPAGHGRAPQARPYADHQRGHRIPAR